jgi:hypothetical protein
MAEQEPWVGRVVHYVSEGSPVQPDGTQKYASKCRAADITEVGAWITDSIVPESPDGTIRTLRQHWDPEACALHVVNPTGQFFNLVCMHDESEPGTPGTWHWPERVPTTPTKETP